MFNLNSKSNIGVGLQNFLKNNKWMFFVFILWAITYIALTEGILTRSRTITVTGSSVNSVANEIATFNINLNTKNKDKIVAVDETNKKTAVIVEALKNFGIEDKNLKVANMSIYRDQNYINNTYVEGDWNVALNIDIKLLDTSKVNDLTNLITSMDVTNFYGPNYTTDTINMDETALLESAMKDATSKASNIAKNLNKKLGKVVYVSEDGVSTGYGNMYFAKMSGGAGGGGAEMMPGSTDVYKSVVVTYEIH